jgi:hypothetical protein
VILFESIRRSDAGCSLAFDVDERTCQDRRTPHQWSATRLGEKWKKCFTEMNVQVFDYQMGDSDMEVFWKAKNFPK